MFIHSVLLDKGYVTYIKWKHKQVLQRLFSVSVQSLVSTCVFLFLLSITFFGDGVSASWNALTCSSTSISPSDMFLMSLFASLEPVFVIFFCLRFIFLKIAFDFDFEHMGIHWNAFERWNVWWYLTQKHQTRKSCLMKMQMFDEKFAREQTSSNIVKHDFFLLF